jgi:hypothetical protein
MGNVLEISSSTQGHAFYSICQMKAKKIVLAGVPELAFFASSTESSDCRPDRVQIAFAKKVQVIE